MSEKRQHPLGLVSASAFDDRASTTSSAPGQPGLIDRKLVGLISARCNHPPVRIVLWDGHTGWDPGPDSIGSVIFRDRGALWATIWEPELGFGDMFSAGRIVIEGNLIRVLFAVFRSADTQNPKAFKRNWFGRLPKAATNTFAGSRRHIEHHYDLGNDFYRLWLDERMVYTCAYYPTQQTTLEQAQVAKMDHVARKLELKPGMDVVEAGCGWGALAIHMAKHFGVQVKAFNISREQLEFARSEAKRQGLASKVKFIEEDYRNIAESCDAFVSVGMLEHVGVDNYAELGRVVARVLRRDAKGLIHSVGRARPTAPNAWLENRIFPGSYPPCIGEMMGIFEPFNLSVIDIENLRLHYARTLTEWLERFDAHADQVEAMYDTAFVQAWRLYLGGCAASFLSSSTQLYQVLFSRPDNNKVSMTRAHLYSGSEAVRWDAEL